MRLWRLQFSLFLCSISLALFVLTPACLGQQAEQFEALLETTLEKEGSADVLPEVEYLLSHPLDVNRASAAELARIPFFRSDIADSIVASRLRHGRFTSLDELVTRGVLRRDELERVRPFLRAGGTRGARSGLRFRLRAPRGPGEGAGTYSRLLLATPPGMDIGLVLERDAGEARWSDFKALHADWRWRGRLHLVVGDYDLRVGQGLLFSGPYAPRPGAFLTPLVRSGTAELRGYLSTSESWALHGGAIEYNALAGRAILFGSVRRRDGELGTDGCPHWDLDGVHRTPSELARRDALRESVAGAHLAWSVRSLGRVGLTLAAQRVVGQAGQEERQVKNAALALDWQRPLRGGLCFGEMVLQRWRWTAAVVGVQLARRDFEALCVVYQYRDSPLTWFRARSFVYSTGWAQARGMLLGGRWDFGAWGVAYHLDLRDPRATEPGRFAATERFVNAWLRLGRGMRTELRLSEKPRAELEKMLGEAGRPRWGTLRYVWRSARAQIDARSGVLRSRIRLQPVWVGAIRWSTPDGFLFYEELGLEPAHGLGVTVRFTTFDVCDSRAAVYAFEPDVPGSFYVRRFLGRGWQTLLLLRAALRSLTLTVKMSWLNRIPASVLQKSWACQLDVRL